MPTNLLLFTEDHHAQLAHTEQQIQCCAQAANDPLLSENERQGARLGWQDWVDNRERILEEILRHGSSRRTA
jgi:hypothetical protein